MNKRMRIEGHRWAVILAGGDGRRLLPLTRRISGDNRPKQYCSVLGGETLLDQTLHRVGTVVNPERTLCVVTKTHERFYSPYAGDGTRFLAQPANCGTCPAIVYSLMRVNRMDPQAVVGFFPSDHHFGDEAAFTDCVSRVFEAAQLRPHAVTLVGIAPDEPETGYGWIEPGEPLMASGPGILFSVRRFWEKPSKSLAIELMQRGCFWNSFIMVGRVEAFFELISRAAPSLVNCFRSIAPALGTENEAARVNECYQRIPSSSFSTDVLSACPDNLAVFCSKKLEWADVGEVNRALSVIAGAGQPETDRILTLAG